MCPAVATHDAVARLCNPQGSMVFPSNCLITARASSKTTPVKLLGCQVEHPCLLFAGVPNCSHIMPSTISTCSRYGSTWGGLMGNGARERTLTSTLPHGIHRPPDYALKDGHTGGVLNVAPRTSSVRDPCGARTPQQGAGHRCSHGCSTSLRFLTSRTAFWGEVKQFLHSLPPSLSKMKNLILVFTAPPRWINPFLASPSPGKSCESNAGPSGSHCSNSCFSPAALCKVL